MMHRSRLSLYDPTDGKFLVEPVRHREEILDDVAGHYGRPDIFEVSVHREARPMIRTVTPEPRED